MEHLTIGKMAKLNHISEQTLRLYDQMGLLSPCEKGAENGYRYYSIKQSARLDMIQYMKSMGMSLKDIKLQLDSGDNTLFSGILRQKSRQIDAQIRELKYQKRAIERTLEGFERYDNAPPDGTILVEYLGKRRMYSIDSHVNFYDYGIEVYEKILRELKESLITDRLPQIYFCNAGSILRQENLEQRRFISTEVFVFVDPDFVEERLTTVIPGGAYLCIYCDCFDKERDYANHLLDAITDRGYIICGDYICEVIAEHPLPGNRERGMFLRLQIPIRFR